jgi:hypothetical protein
MRMVCESLISDQYRDQWPLRQTSKSYVDWNGTHLSEFECRVERTGPDFDAAGASV